ncbi:MAG: DUF4394 domain-containing protein [Phycisphaerales bacterium]|nr:DUF4394 domain-containing protein [Phycisphaerales bacterium]
MRSFNSSSVRALSLAALSLPFITPSLSSAELIYAVTQDQTLISFNSSTPGTILSGVAISGLATNESIRGIDLRPANGEVYALGSFSNLYRLNLTTGAASFVTNGLTSPLNGSSFGFDFNPTVDRIRIVSDADQNLRTNPTGATNTLTDGQLNYVTGDVNFGINPNIVAAAYTNNFRGATSTTLYVLDSNLDILAIQNPPNAGGLMTVGSLGVNINDMASFDISGQTGIAYASVRDINLARTTFWTINLSTGAATFIGEVGGGSILTAMTVVPTPSTLATLALAGLAAARRRRN